MHPAIIEKAHEITYKETKKYFTEEQDFHSKKDMEKQVIISKYQRREHSKKAGGKPVITQFTKGDNIKISPSGELGIVFEGPDDMGRYTVQVQDERRLIPYKRLSLYISAAELYPADYDFDIIFETKENRKKDKLMGKRFVEGLTIERE
jgi:DNA mismatch repair protein MutS2